jgi:hypothetical protein
MFSSNMGKRGRCRRDLPLVSRESTLSVQERLALLAGTSASLADTRSEPSSSSSHPPAPSQAHRADTPVIRGSARGQASEAITGLASSGLDLLVADLQGGKFARSAAAPRVSLLRTWLRFHEAAFGTGVGAVPLLPVTVRSFVAVAALFKRGNYRAFPNYASAIKLQHVEAGHLWTQQLDNACRWCSRSVLRGIGPARQSQALWLSNLLTIEVGSDPLTASGCWNPWHMTMLSCMFLLREIELAHAMISAWTFNHVRKELTWNLPSTKSDPSALGTARTWGCLCDVAGLPCPYHVALEHHTWMLAHAPSSGNRLEWPNQALFPDREWNVTEKVGIVSTFEALAELVSQPIRSPTGARLLGGHSARVTGAQVLASHGVEVNKLRILARHSGDTILRYVGEAPLASIRLDLGVGLQTPNLPGASSVLSVESGLEPRLAILEAAVSRMSALGSAHESICRPAASVALGLLIEN